MSIQGKIDYHLSREGGRLLNMVIIGESGDANIPDGVNVSFYDCEIGNLTAKKDNAIFIGGSQSKVTGTYDQSAGSLIAENTQFIGEVFWRKGNRVKQIKDSTFYLRITAFSSVVELYNCGWEGFGSFAIRAMDRSNVKITDCTLKKRTKGVWAVKGSTADLTNVIIATETGIVAEEDCFVNMLHGQLKPTKVGAELKKRSQLYLSAVELVQCDDFHVVLDDHSKLFAHNTNFEPSVKTSIKAKKHCNIEVVDADYIKSTANHTIDLTDNCKARFIDIRGTIESQAKNAIRMKEKCTVTCVDVQTIESKGDDAIFVQDNASKFEATSGISSTIKGQKSAINSKNNTTVSVDGYQLIQGISAEAVLLENEANAYFSGNQIIQSLAATSIKMSNESGLTLQDHKGVVEGKGGNGIEAEMNCTLALQSVNSVLGKAGDGIKVSNNTNLDIIYTQLIDGQAGFGINAEQNCDVKYTRSTKLTGALGGIKNTNLGSLNVELVKEIAPKSGVGIKTENQVDTRLVSIKRIDFGVSHTNCEVVVKDCPGIDNKSGPAVSANGGEIELKNIKASGQGASVVLANTSAKATNTDLTSNIVATESIVSMNGVQLTGDINATDSALDFQLVAITGNIALAGCTLDYEKSSAIGMVLTASVLKSRLGSATTCSLLNSSAEMYGAGFPVPTLAGASTCIICAGGQVLTLTSGS